MNHAPRVLRLRRRVAVQVAVFALPEDVLAQDGGGDEPAEVARGDEALPALLLGEVPRDDEGTLRRAEARGGEEVPLGGVLERGVAVRVDVRETPRGGGGKHQRAAPPPTVALHAVHLHERRVAEDHHLRQRAQPFFLLLLVRVVRRVGGGLTGPARPRLIPDALRQILPRLEPPRGAFVAALGAAHLRQFGESREVRDGASHLGDGEEELDAREVARGGPRRHRVQPLGDPPLVLRQPRHPDGGDEGRHRARGAG